MHLSRDSGCVHGLTWRIESADTAEFERLYAAIAALGWEEHPGIGELLVHAVPGGHRLLVVPSTTRVQLRLSYLVPVEHRAETARLVFARLDSSCVPPVAPAFPG